MPSDGVVNSLRLSQGELESLLAELNRAAGQPAVKSKRKNKRWRLQYQRMVVTLVDVNHSKIHLMASPRNISRTGASFLNGSFLHPGTKVFITMRGVTGAGMNLAATVMRCQHIKGRIHEVGVQFNQPINPRDFFIELGDEYIFNCEAVDLSKLSGTVLIIDDSVASQRLIQHHFRGAPLKMICANSADEGLAAMARDPDVVFVDYNLPGLNGIDLIFKARDQGYSQPMILITAENDKELRMAAIGAGASEMLTKPTPPELLHRAVAEFIGMEQEVARPVSTTGHAPEPIDRSDVTEYTEELHRIAEKLTLATDKADATELRGLLMEVSSTAEAYGFQPIADGARESVRLLEMAGGVTRAASELKRLVRMCEQAKPPKAREAASQNAPAPGAGATKPSAADAAPAPARAPAAKPNAPKPGAH